MIEFKNVSKIYKTKKGVETKALNNINLKIGNIGMVFIVGKSGSGKSTMLNLLGGLDNVTSGELLINNQNISNFKNKQYDSYRNTYIGFIFQEFNILDQYNVYENIELALRLQNKKTGKETIDNLLNKLGLNNLGQRKTNELSGGQKQRVAIARALIKNPKIILADEPTGNLDKTSSKQIFDLLKEISKEKLVIVVSHDMESAATYADRIIELSDGNVIHDTNPENEIKKENINPKKSKLPFSYAIKMALKSLTIKPFKLLMTCILTAMALIFMGFTINCLIFDDAQFVANTMKENNEYTYNVGKAKFMGIMGSDIVDLTNEDLNTIAKETNSILNPNYILYNNDSIVTVTFGGQEIEQKPEYYEMEPSAIFFTEIKDDNLIQNLIGSLPSNDREIVVHKYFAEYMIKYGIIDSQGELYKPKSIDEIIDSKHEIKLGNDNAIISGIIDDNQELYKKYQNKQTFDSEKLKTYFNENYSYLGSHIYVKGFTDTATLNSDKSKVLNRMLLTNIIDNIQNKETISSMNLQALNTNTNIITSDGLQTINTLEKKQIVLSLNDLKQYDSNLNQELDNYLKQNSNISYGEAVQTFLQNYLKTTNFTNLKLKLVLNQYENNRELPVTIVGVTLDEKTIVSNQFVEEYNPPQKELIDLTIYDNNVDNLKQVFNKFKISSITYPQGTFYTYTPHHENNITSVITTYDALYKYILVASLVFVLFAVLLFSNFIGVSISYSKKEIGILRALGARNKDTLKIFTYESLIIGLISWILAIIGWIYTCDLLNNSMFGNMYYTLNGILKSPLVPLGMFIFTIIISLVVTFTAISRVNKVKPIDAILNK